MISCCNEKHMKKAGVICLSAAAVFLSLYFCGCGDSHVSEEISGSSAPYEPAADEPDNAYDLPDGFTVTFDRGTDIGYRVSETENGTIVYFEGNILDSVDHILQSSKWAVLFL